MTDYWVGIDPGLEGAIAVVDNTGTVVECIDIGKQDSRLFGISSEVNMHAIPEGSVVLVEDLSRTIINSKSTEFSKGYNLGRTIAYLEPQAKAVFFIGPDIWKPSVGATGDKELSRELAAKIPGAAQYVTRKMDHDRAEAILLAHLAWSMRSNRLYWEELFQIPLQARQDRKKRRSSRRAKKGPVSTRARALPKR